MMYVFFRKDTWVKLYIALVSFLGVKGIQEGEDIAPLDNLLPFSGNST